jgi:transcriptional regulator with XRE-family HTH domain
MANNLREVRIRRNVSQLLLSQRTGICQSTLSKIEHGWIPANAKQRKALARVLKVRESRLFPESEK